MTIATTITSTISTELRRAVDDARTVLTDAKPLHAVAGAGDLVAERVRSVRLNRVGATVRSSVLTLPERTTAAVLGAVGQATTAYDDLADRGASLVGRVRRQAATRDLGDRVDNTVRSAKATATTVRNAAAAAGAAASATADKTGTPKRTTSTRPMRASSTAPKPTATRATAKRASSTAPKPAAKRPATKSAATKSATTKSATTKSATTKRATATKA